MIWNFITKFLLKVLQLRAGKKADLEINYVYCQYICFVNGNSI